MKKICFLTCKDLHGYVVDDQLAIDYIQSNHDYQVTSVPWDEDYEWKNFNLILIRTTWDYVQRIGEFLPKLEYIATQTKLLNSVEVVKWNYHKRYLKDLEKRGVKIVPTHVFQFPSLITPPPEWECDKFILKPAVSATAYKTIIVKRKDLNNPEVTSILYPGDWLLQPFMDNINQGEISLCFYNKTFSHSVLKVPKSGDFRVQEEHGGDIKSYTPDESLLNIGQKIVSAIPFDHLYARVDLVKYKNDFVLMELELIEPSLYFRTNSQSVVHFKRALDKAVQLNQY